MITSKIAFCCLGLCGLAGLSATTAIYWKNITENSVVKYIYNSIYEISHMDELLETMEAASPPLDSTMPTYTLLSSNNSSESNGDTFGSLYGNVLVSNTNNDAWWKWSIKRIGNAGDLSGGFSSLASKGENDFAELRTACENIHKKKDEEVKDGERANTWFLCSPFLVQPHAVSEIPKARYRGMFASAKENRAKHLVGDRPANKNVWDEIYKKLISPNSSTISDAEFKKVKSGYGKKYVESAPALNKLCDRFYAKAEDEVTSSKESIWKYCSLSGKEITASADTPKEN